MGRSSAFGEPVETVNRMGRAPIVLICEHASAVIPDHLERLGLEEEAALSHAAWDPGALAVASRMAADLDAPLVAAKISRLVYDCNRPPQSATAMTVRTEIYDVPGNRELDEAARRERIAAIYEPFHASLAWTIEGQVVTSAELPALISIHSFSPTWLGTPRPTEIGVLFGGDDRLGTALIDALRDQAPSRQIAPNEPYSSADGVLHTMERHGERSGLLHAMIEIRSDLVADDEGVGEISALLSSAISEALQALGHGQELIDEPRGAMQ